MGCGWLTPLDGWLVVACGFPAGCDRGGGTIVLEVLTVADIACGGGARCG